MLPSFSSDNSIDSIKGHSKFNRQHFSRCFSGVVSPTYFQYGKVSKNMSSTFLAVCRKVALLLTAVLHVLFWGSNKQMVRIAARRVVAMVAYIQSVWYMAVGKNPRETMRLHSFSNSIISNSERAVAHIVCVSDPFPALLNSPHFDFRPKVVLDWFGVIIFPTPERTSEFFRKFFQFRIDCKSHVGDFIVTRNECQPVVGIVISRLT